MHVTLMLPAAYCPSCILPFSIASLGAGPTAGIVFASAAFICASLLVVYITRWVVMVGRRRGGRMAGGMGKGMGKRNRDEAAYRHRKGDYITVKGGGGWLMPVACMPLSDTADVQ